MRPHDPSVVHLHLHPELPDVAGRRVAEAARAWLGLELGRVKTVRIFVIDLPLASARLRAFATEALCDPVLERAEVGPGWSDPAWRSFALVARHPGVTDDVGITAQRTLEDWLGEPVDTATQHIFSQTLYLFEREVPEAQLARLAAEVLGNPLVEQFRHGPFTSLPWVHPVVGLPATPQTEVVSLERPDEDLLALSQARVLSLDLVEMRAIQAHFRDPSVRAARAARGLPPDPTDCELEVLAQTWSEHCKHKEFNALITYRDLDTGEERVIDSLFKTCIRGSTEGVRARLREAGQGWLVKVFDDNAGVVRIDEERVFVWKVETHNTPSALDPYGGAITGILGNNRDPLGTGVGGARLIFNTDVLCFGLPDHAAPLLPGQLHPARVLEGVRHGIEDGGNKSGIPTVAGAVVFDERYAGKPLVYCGTGGVMPARWAGRPSWEKRIEPGDRILMAGGRVGKDGIHGATFSSAEVDERSPRTAVQIGSPITQKLVTDFMWRACAEGLVRCSTDCGAGGLSSAVGELATIPGGAVVQLAEVPLKYPGLMPWEIFVSEAQERMLLVVGPADAARCLELARQYEVELTDIGAFTDAGLLEVRYGAEVVACLGLDLLHDGVPRKRMEAEWRAPRDEDPPLSGEEDFGALLLALLRSPDICSREGVIRQYDHEVQGRTVIKPLMGARGVAPQDAAVLRLDHGGWDAIAVSVGICPRYGDLDAYAMSAGAFDEAVRQILAVGGRLPGPDAPENLFWSVNDNFCVPDSAFHPVHNPDGKYKLAQLVRMAEALHDLALAYCVPMTSGKDSMKNDFRAGGVKISVPPTILYSAVARIPDLRRCRPAQFVAPGDVVVLLGRTYHELGASQLLRLRGERGASVPRVRVSRALDLYHRLGLATERGLLASCHDLSDGGLGVALAECCFGSGLGCEVSVEGWDLGRHALLFSESHSRFVASLRAEDLPALRQVLGEHCHVLGVVTEEPRMRVRHRDTPLMDLDVSALLEAWRAGPVAVVGGVR
ncbi:MAG: AIR synthase-related protein [Pseudomonadota bacterium]